MAFNLLAILAFGFIAAAEGLSPSRIYLASILFAIAIGLLVFAWHASYFLLAIVFAACGSCGVLLYRLPSEYKEPQSGLQGMFLGKVAPVLVAGVVHFFGIWLLPILVVWNYANVYDDMGTLFVTEIGHVFPSSIYYSVLILLPLLLAPRGYYRGTIKHQWIEGITVAMTGFIDFLIFRISHHIVRKTDIPMLSASDWDHELLGLVWLGGGLVGFLTAIAGYKTSAHISFPALVICYSMMSHSHAAANDVSAEQMAGWRMSWMALHKVHGMCFGVGATCRILYRIPEAVFFFYLGCLAFVFSSGEVVKWLFNNLNNTKDPFSGWSPDCDPNCNVHFPTAHVVVTVVVSLGALSFPIHLGLCEQLRKFTEQMAPAAFSALPVCAEDGDEDHHHHDDEQTYETLALTEDCPTEASLSAFSEEATSNGGAHHGKTNGLV